jgi:hypothetical protein
VTTQHELTERDREISRLEDELIAAFLEGRLTQDAFARLLTSTKIAAEGLLPLSDPQAAADRALDRLRRAAEAVRS